LLRTIGRAARAFSEDTDRVENAVESIPEITSQAMAKAPALFVAEAVKELPYAIRSAAGGFLAEETRKTARRWVAWCAAAVVLALAIGAGGMWFASDWIDQRGAVGISVWEVIR
jgi:hypothetical protein